MPKIECHNNTAGASSPYLVSSRTNMDGLDEGSMAGQARDSYDEVSVTARPVTGDFASLSGRVPPQFNSVINYVVSQGLKEIGLTKVQEMYERGGGTIDLPYGGVLGLKVSEKTYYSGDSYIQSDEIRKHCSELFRERGLDVVWVESGGVIEIGKEGNGVLPLNAYADLAGGAGVSGIARYRRLEPYDSPSGRLPERETLQNILDLPLTAVAAKKMPHGSEFELVLEARAGAAGDFVKGAFANIGPFLAGADARVGVSGKAGGDILLIVQRLPEGEKVMVKIIHSQTCSAKALADIHADVSVDQVALDKIPERAQSVLQFLLSQAGLPKLSMLAEQYGKATAVAELGADYATREMARYVFDLSKPKAREAYENLVQKMSTHDADELSKTGQDGVMLNAGGETSTSLFANAQISLGNVQLVESNTSLSQRKGHVSSSFGEDVIAYRESKYQQKFKTWFFGDKRICLEAVGVKNKGATEEEHFYHLTFEHNNFVTSEEDVRDILNLARALGIQISDPCESVLPHMSMAQKVFSSQDDTHVKVDIYFSNKGIRRIDEAKFNDAMIAYLETQQFFSKQAKPLPFVKKVGGEVKVDVKDPNFETLQQYNRIQCSWFLVRLFYFIFYFFSLKKMQDDYEIATNGRSLKDDAKALQEAKEFARYIEELDAENHPESVNSFFSNMGWSKGFDFTKTIAAMARLAGEKETIIHSLSMTGGGVSLQGADEGIIVHPDRQLADGLTRLRQGEPLAVS